MSIQMAETGDDFQDNDYELVERQYLEFKGELYPLPRDGRKWSWMTIDEDGQVTVHAGEVQPETEVFLGQGIWFNGVMSYDVTSVGNTANWEKELYILE